MQDRLHSGQKTRPDGWMAGFSMEVPTFLRVYAKSMLNASAGLVAHGAGETTIALVSGDMLYQN